MQVAKSIMVKVSKKINKDKFLSLRDFFNTCQTVARLYYSYILENSLEEKLCSGVFFKVKVNGSKRVTVPIECGEMQKQLLKDALNGKYKIGAFQLVRKDSWFYFVIPIKKEVEIKQSYDGVVGVDLGLRNNAVITLLHKNRKITNVEFVKYRKLMHKIRMLWHRIDELKSMLPEGQRTSKRIQRLWKRIRRINNWIAHNVSKRIVEVAKENNAMIAMENLKRLYPVKGNSRKLNRRISNWVRGKIVKCTIYKARWEGIKVKLVSAKNTSKKCHLCGSQGLRTGANFFCVHCKHSYNADFNASVNIGIRATLPDARGCVNHPVCLPNLSIPFDASWYVAMFNASTSEMISEDEAEWIFVAKAEERMTPEEILKEITLMSASAE